ncbi:hypothetical protein PRNP1_007157 [Phytophthora ramorum]
MQFCTATVFLLMTYAAAAENVCPPTEVVKFAELYANPHLHPCQKTSAGFSMAPPMGYPTEPQVKAMCSSDACHALIKDVLALTPGDCYLSFAGVKLNVYKLSHSFADACKTDKSHENGKYEPTPKPIDDKHYPTPKPTDGKYYPTVKPTEDNKHYPTPKPTHEKYYPTPKPTKDSKHYPTPKSTNEEHTQTKEPKALKVDSEETSSPKQCAEKESAEDSDMKPPMNGTAEELYPMPNTTYKAIEPKTSLKA